ncbi:hypothetical protein T459_13143 [Capsicum annuum]|uniref:KOW domain-containing protein n=1 Tax=Capsicum annuum TaxID=4072 RepID=A0A2G2ZRT3_CAPAN|nr:hypothetical protein T459_13143 [Capsicum annuum]
MKDVIRFGRRGKLSPGYIGPFEILQRVGEVDYVLALPPAFSAIHLVYHVSMLRQYIPDESHVLQWDSVQLDKGFAFVEEPTSILARDVRRLRSGTFRGTYKGDLAQIVNGDDIRRRVTVKLIPRIDFRALVNHFDGIKIPKEEKFCPPARFWSATKAKALGIPVTRQKDSVTGDYFDTVNGMKFLKFKDGLLYKSVSIRSIGYKGRVLRIDDDVVYLKLESEGLPQSVAIHSKDLCKIFELGDYVKVVSGGKEGATGTITSVKGHVVTVLPDKSINTFDVLADHVEENSEVAYSRVPPRSVSIPNVRPLPPPKKGNVYGDVRSASIANFRRPPSPQKKGYDFGRARRDPLLNARIKIRQGLHNGMVGRVVEVRGHRVRIELEAQMNHAYVDRS